MGYGQIPEDETQEVVAGSYISFGETPDEAGKDAGVTGFVIAYEREGGNLYKKPDEKCPLVKLWTQEGELKNLNCAQPNLMYKIQNAREIGTLSEGSVLVVKFDGWRPSNKEDKRCSPDQKKKDDFKTFSVRVKPAGEVTDEFFEKWFPPLTGKVEPF